MADAAARLGEAGQLACAAVAVEGVQAAGLALFGEVACGVPGVAGGAAFRVSMGQRQPLAVVAGAAAVARRIAGFNEVAPAVVYVVFGEGVRPTAVFGA